MSLSRLKIRWDLRILYLYRRLEHGGKQAKRESKSKVKSLSDGCDRTSIKALDHIRTLQLSVFGRE